jgi:glutathione S-transferase
MELYFAPLACSMSARIALAEAGAAIDLAEVDTHAGRIVATGDDYRAVNPLGYVPALRLDDGTVLTENSAILQFSPTNIRRLSSRRRLPTASGAQNFGNG